ncbi:LysM repeat protein [Haloferula luteola]|uniref:LysM repeat protein n=1 Tax=Haloferula luteola TaxID=595692 RepID=A0A840UY96_9BACT|nr:LysM peptidoglycan-binding domain-containing protein [Haloferula luteola]MBB5350752.1 LysM repeat protein [Haloferula luteola]
MNPTLRFSALIGAAALSSCSLFNKEENYDTASGYDTSNPYGVPSSGGYESAPYQDVNAPATDPSYGSAAYEEAAVTPAPAPIPAAPTPSASLSSHTVVKGDTLWGISRKYGVTVDAIRSANGMAAGDTNVRLGQTISIPAR